MDIVYSEADKPYFVSRFYSQTTSGATTADIEQAGQEPGEEAKTEG